MSFVRETAVKATRKPHKCHGCRKLIEAGTRAVRWSGMTDGDFGAERIGDERHGNSRMSRGLCVCTFFSHRVLDAVAISDGHRDRYIFHERNLADCCLERRPMTSPTNHEDGTEPRSRVSARELHLGAVSAVQFAQSQGKELRHSDIALLDFRERLIAAGATIAVLRVRVQMAERERDEAKQERKDAYKFVDQLALEIAVLKRNCK